MDETIRIKYDGGLATGGQLHYYEFSRSQYALARFISTIEHFRRTGEVAERINSRTYVELLISTPERGSFIQDILIESFKDGMGATISAAFLALFAYVWHLLSPRREKTDKALLEIAKIKLAMESERTRQQRERTAQLVQVRAIAEGTRASASEAIELLKWSQTIPIDIADSLTTTEGQRLDMLKEVEAEKERLEEFSGLEANLNGVDETDFNRLTSRLRPMVSDMSLPLKRSAGYMNIGAKNEGYQQLAYITPEIVKLIQARTTEEEITEIRGRIKSYDRDAGIGKVQSDELPRVLNFTVPIVFRAQLRDKILAAMRENTVTIVCRYVVDEGHNPTSLILLDVIVGPSQPPRSLS